MFKKKPTIKPLSPLKSSERRRTADQIIADFNIQVPVDADADDSQTTAADDKTAPSPTPALTALRKSLLPENALCARFTTTAGPDLKQVSGTIYVGSHEGTHGHQRVLWAKVADKMYPTVYTLWHNPRIVPLLHTPLVVVEKLQGGADLMIPGLQRGPPFPRGATKGAVVAIASLEAPTVPMAVGTCEIDVSILDKVQGVKGQAVSTFHWAGDELWAWSATSNPGSDPPDLISAWDDEAVDDKGLAERTAAIDLDHDDQVALEAGPVERSEAEQRQGVDGEDAPSSQGFLDIIPDKELTTKGNSPSKPCACKRLLTVLEIDDAFVNAFLFGVRHHMKTNRDHPTHGLDFPLSQSHVMAQLVQPFLPTYTPARTSSLQIKKTSWKNLRKFIKYLDKQTIVKSKDRDGNEVVVMDINFKDRRVEAFVPYQLPKKDAPTAATASSNATTSAASESSVGQTLRVISLLRPKEKLLPILQASKADPRGLYTPAELRQHLLTYVESENLVDSKNKRMIRINPQIADALLGTSATDNAALAKGVITRDALAERMLAAAAPFHTILRNHADVNDSKPKAGAPPKIQITLETRSGNKTVSKVHGLEPYHIAPQPLADELRKTCAGSTSIDKLQGSSPKAPVMEVMVQGPQKDAILKALEKRGVNRTWVEVVDKTKGKKK